jgi:hypothetical protein
MRRTRDLARGAVGKASPPYSGHEENMEMRGIIVKLSKCNYYHREFAFQRCGL